MASPTPVRVLLGIILVTAAWITLGSASRADGVADFYHGKSFTIVVGSAPGGGYDAYARLIARHFGRHVPGDPAVTVQNMPGAGSLNMVNHVANIAPRDGTIAVVRCALNEIVPRGHVLVQLEQLATPADIPAPAAESIDK